MPDFLDEGKMSQEMYPEIGTTIGAVVVGYNESNCREIYLNVKPSMLHKALVPLKFFCLNLLISLCKRRKAP
jgi:ethanolamine transporter EutH